MDRDQLRGLLDQVRSGAVEVDAAMERMRHLPFEDLGFANVDHHRALRHGIHEAALRLQIEHSDAEYFCASKAVRIWRDRAITGRGKIAVICAGTSDLPVAEEAQVTAEVMGNEVFAIPDIGVAGIHRLMHHRERLAEARVVIVCAGMEGALPSAVGGIVSAPVIAVPTSVGYGASFQGLAALLGMLNSCASNVTVVNIDNGFGAGYVASLINRL